jgi:hypothetical protein
MATPEEELQSAVDRGELRVKSNEQLRRAIDTTERRWIVMQVKDIAVHQALTPEQFKDLCEYIRAFTTAPAADPAV